MGVGCIRVNETGFSFGVGLSAGVGYALQVTAPRALSVAGFDYYTRSTRGQQVLQTRLYDAAPSGQPGTVLATGTMTVGSSTGWYQIREDLETTQHDDIAPSMETAGLLGRWSFTSEEAARQNRWEFLLTTAPLRVGGGTGSPLNPIATF